MTNITRQTRLATYIALMLTAMIVGVLIAVSAFVLQELVRWFISGVLFRQRLVVDIQSIVKRFEHWQPPPQLAVASPPAEYSVAPIWDYGFETLGDVYSHSSNLRADLFVRVVDLYSACGRFDEIRCAHNAAIIAMISASDQKPWIAVLNAELHDIQRVVQEIVTEGRSILRGMNDYYWVRGIDPDGFDETAERKAKARSASIAG